eukprot:TRINITY_DN11105_c0_g2_i5.p1 TRINITY_DN11105_c0_g2~~TRINITY_DN11105_c0_g2_i5.p1  ORF type:complete len:555 (+),score=65.34 TRINITY_DN11105_c0_g2_i5:97-1761(+)
MQEPSVEGHLPASTRSLSRNVVSRLRILRRFPARCGAQAQNFRHLHQSVYPTKCKSEFARPSSFAIEGFTPDGRFLLGWSFNPAGHAQLNVMQHRRDLSDATDFEAAFPLKSSVQLDVPFVEVQRGELIFPPNTNYVIIPARVQVAASNQAHGHSRVLRGLKFQHKVQLLVVDYERCEVTDKVVFAHDHIVLGDGLGITFKNGYLAVTSLRFQELRLYHLRPDGALVPFVNIGEHCLPDDELLLQQSTHPDRVPLEAQPQSSGLAPLSQHLRTTSSSPFANSSLLTGLQQKIMACLFRQAKESKTLAMFYFHFEDYLQLVIWQAALINHHLAIFKLGPSHLLLKCRNDPVALFKDSIDIPGMLCYFAVFDFGCGEMLTIRPNTDKDLLETYQSAAEHFQPRPPCRLLIGHRTPSDSHYYRDELEKLLEFLLTSRNGGYDQAIRRCLNTFLPTRRVPNRWSPLLDRDLFSFDEASILLGHHAGTDLIKFQSRQRQRVTFSLDPNARPAEGLCCTLGESPRSTFHLNGVAQSWIAPSSGERPCIFIPFCPLCSPSR